MNRVSQIAAVAGLALAAAAFAAPRETFPYTAVNSNGPQGNAVNEVRNFNAVGGYTAGKISHSGGLTAVNIETYASESRILVTPPGGRPTFILQPFTSAATFSGQITYAADTALTPPFNPAGAWNLRFFESFDDGGTGSIDAVWDTFNFTLDDEVPPPPPPPPAEDIGNLAQNSSVSRNFNLAAGQIFWYRFQTSFDVSVAANKYIDMDTEGSILAPGAFPDDTELGLYSQQGNLVATDDDDGADFHSQLSFGAGQRPAVGNGLIYNGRDGSLPAGVYYMACTGYNGVFGATGFAVTSTSTNTGNFVLNIRNGRGICRADYNNDGQVDLFDYLDFVQDFAAGCD